MPRLLSDLQFSAEFDSFSALFQELANACADAGLTVLWWSGCVLGVCTPCQQQTQPLVWLPHGQLPAVEGATEFRNALTNPETYARRPHLLTALKAAGTLQVKVLLFIECEASFPPAADDAAMHACPAPHTMQTGCRVCPCVAQAGAVGDSNQLPERAPVFNATGGALDGDNRRRQG